MHVIQPMIDTPPPELYNYGCPQEHLVSCVGSTAAGLLLPQQLSQTGS